MTTCRTWLTCLQLPSTLPGDGDGDGGGGGDSGDIECEIESKRL